MTSLREKQKERRRRDIMDAASALIGEKGFDETSIEEIAAKAEVGPATVYNYFGSKNELLQAMFIDYIEEQAQEGETALVTPPDDMAAGMAGLFERYLEGLANRCSPRLLREFYALAISKQFDYGRRTYELKRRFLEQGLRLATYYKERGKVRDDVSADEAATLCYSAAVFPLSLLGMGLGVDLEAARQMLRRYLTLILAGIGRQTPGNEGTLRDAQSRTLHQNDDGTLNEP